MRTKKTGPTEPITNTALDDDIRYHLKSLPPAVALGVVAKIQAAVGDEVMHKFRELEVGAAIARAGATVDYERRLGTQTPDWVLLDSSGAVSAVVDVVTHHLAKEMEDERKAVTATLKPIAPGIKASEVWVAWPENTQRLWQKIDDKIGTYAVLVRGLAVPFVVVVVTNIDAGVDSEEISECTDGPASVFIDRPDLSGVLFFPDGAAPPHYRSNPNASHPFKLSVRRWDNLPTPK